MRTCRRCKQVEPIVAFTPKQTSLCKSCTDTYNREYHARNREKILERQALHRREHPEKVKAAQRKWLGRRTEYNRTHKLMRAYGLNPGEYESMLARQGGVCAICKMPPQGKHPLHVDHDHACCPRNQTCGRCIRGLLCNHCNRGLGAFMDNGQLLSAAAAYLKMIA